DLVAESPFTAAVLPEAPPGLLNARSLPERALLLYALSADTNQGPVALVRKKNPHPVARAGRIYALLGNALSQVDRPVFTLDIESVRNHIRAVGLSEDELVSGDELVVDEADPMTLLYLLNEDFFTGGLTTTGFRSERKAPRA